MKNKLLLLLIPILLIISVGGYFVYKNVPKQSDRQDQVKLTNEELAQQVATDWLESYKKDNTPFEDKIVDYKIEKIDGVTLKNDQLDFSVKYAVKLGKYTDSGRLGSNWVAGNGIDDGDWMIHKIGFATATKVNGKYKLTGIGTGA